MAVLSDNITSTLSFFGRLTDALRRETVGPSEYRAVLAGLEKDAMRKPDGYFVFQNLKPSPVDYAIRISGSAYQERGFKRNLPTPDPVELAFPGEDEFYLGIKSVNAAANTVVFDKVPFLHRIAKGSRVSGQAGFISALAEDLQGVDATTAKLASVAGLAPGQLLRILRSRSLLAKPGPYYPFPPGSTLLHVKANEDMPGESALEGALIRIQSLNGLAPATTVVDGLALRHLTLPAPPNPILVLGPQWELETRSDSRGQAVFHFPGHWPLSAVQIEVSHPGHVSKVVPLALVAGQRTLAAVKLVPV